LKVFEFQLVFVLTLSSVLSACSYRSFEEMSPRHQKGTPVMSDVQVVCRARVIVNPEDEHPPLDFMVEYDRLWDVTVYPNYPKKRQPYPEQLCKQGFSTQIISNTGIGGLYTKLPNESKYDTSASYNMDPDKGAVRVWELPFIEIDGLNYIATMVSFYPMIIKGHKLPTGSNFSRGIFTTSPYTTTELISIKGRAWKYYKHEFVVGRDVPEHSGYKAGHTSFEELYTTQIGNYTFAMVASYDDGLATNAPVWLNSRRLFLREWLETFEFVPIQHELESLEGKPTTQPDIDDQ
jgi:hypothetical protein